MAIFGCERGGNCVNAAVIVSVIVGIVTALLRITATITVTPAFLWAVLGVAVVYLAVTLATAPWLRSVSNGCGVRAALSALLIGILGTILLSIVLLAITFVATSVVGAIITGLLALFFSLTITATACLVKRIVNGND